MSNYIIKYSRDKRVKYISHLDFVRMFHRAVRRSGLKMVFSQGFNPHPVMTVACPLSVGVTADNELMKIGFEDGCGEEEILNALNSSLPPGFGISKVKRVEGKEINLNDIDRARYTVEAEIPENLHISIASLLSKKEIIVPKRTKSGEKDTDIRSMIYEMKLLSYEGNLVVLEMVIACGNSANLKPETVLAAMSKYIDGFECEFYNVHRNELLNKRSEQLL